MRRLWFVSLLVLCITFSGCSEEGKVKEQAVKEHKIEIGFSMDSIVIERWQRDRDVFIAAAKTYGANVNFQNAHGDSQEQIRQIEYLIDEKVSVIVIVAGDAEKLTEVIKKAKNNGISVIAYDRIIKCADVNLYISFDNQRVGILMAEAMNQGLKSGGNIIMAMGSNADENVTQVEKGIMSTLKKKINVVKKSYAVNWQAEEAFRTVSEYFNETPAVDGVICGNDDLAGQVVRSLSEVRLAGKTVVVGQDADIAACQRIVEGTQYMTVYKAFDEMAKEAARAAIILSKGENYLINETYYDGEYHVPFKKYEPVAVTKENLKEVIIDSGFHLEDDVYLARKY